MEILLLGHNGYLGNYLKKRFQKTYTIITDISENYKTYKYVINCAGLPNLEYCEYHKDQCKAANLDPVYQYTRLFPESKFINFSSYYVYNGYGLNLEDRTSNLDRQYCYTKCNLEAEEVNKNGINFRLGKLFGLSGGKEQKKLTESLIQYATNIELDRVLFNPTSLETVGDVIQFELGGQGLSGIYNLANDGFSTHYDYGNFISNFLGKNRRIDTGPPAKSFTHYGKNLMSVDKLANVIPLRHWKDDMTRYLNCLGYARQDA